MGQKIMTDCKGVLGKLFGHKYVKFTLQKCGIKNPVVEFNGFTGDTDHAAKMFFESLIEKYEIRCKRCGRKCE